MAKPGRATHGKRTREMQKQDKRKEKEEKRAVRKEEKASATPVSRIPGEDPDLAGIIPGPQKPQE